MINKFSRFKLNESKEYEYIAYHSTDFIIDDFEPDKINPQAGSSTRIDGVFFSDIPQKMWGDYLYKVKIISQNPAIFNMKTTRLDSLGVQELFDNLLRGSTGYMIEDLVEYADMEEDEAEDLAEKWRKSDLIVLTNCVYANHSTEYIVPNKYYNGNSAQIINLGLVDNGITQKSIWNY